MKKLLSFIGFLLIIGAANQASAALVSLANDGFELGNLTGWNHDNATVETSPYQNIGTYYAQITGATQGTYDGYTGYGGYISQSVSSTINGGEYSYSFDWLFLFNEGTQWDYAYYKIDGVETKFYEKGTESDPPAGWTTQTIDFSGTGQDVVLEIGVVSYLSDNYSQLLIDATPVPVPASLLLLGTGLFTVAGIGRKKF
ncbi:MAG: PEP-CTERM sorting domain-containing protein [Desulfobacterales bacterium]|nr:PEP-CTERM sorting domain-containing protein [Desulfobacterales bacterium]